MDDFHQKKVYSPFTFHLVSCAFSPTSVPRLRLPSPPFEVPLSGSPLGAVTQCLRRFLVFFQRISLNSSYFHTVETKHLVWEVLNCFGCENKREMVCILIVFRDGPGFSHIIRSLRELSVDVQYHASCEPLRIFWNDDTTCLTWEPCVLPTMSWIPSFSACSGQHAWHSCRARCIVFSDNPQGLATHMV